MSGLPKTAAEAAKVPSDMAARMAADRLIRTTYGGENPKFDPAVDLPKKEPKDPTVYVMLEDTRIATQTSGPMFLRRGQEVVSIPLIAALKTAGAKIAALR